MSVFLEFVRKEFFHIFRDYRTLLVLFGMPAAQLIIFGYAIRTEINSAEIAIYDKSKDYMSKQIIDKIASTSYFKVTSDIQSDFEIHEGFKKGIFQVVIVFPENFSFDLIKNNHNNIQLIIDASDPNFANLINGYLTSIIIDYQNKLNSSKFSSKSSVQRSIITPEVKMFYNPELKSVYMFVPGLLALILMLVSALMTSIAITKEKEMGTMEVLLVSPLRPWIIIIGKVIPYIVLAVINALTVLLLGIFIFNVPFKGSIILFSAETILYLLTCLSLGILISTVAKTQQVALMVSLAGLLMPTVLLSGFIFPVENMPPPLQIVSNIIPAKWYLVIVRTIMLKGLGIEYLWKETIILIFMLIILLLISMKKFKIRLE